MKFSLLFWSKKKNGGLFGNLVSSFLLLLGWLILEQLSCFLKQLITSKLMMTFICALVSEIMKICIMHSVTLINVLWHYKFIFFQLLQIVLQLFLPRNVAIRWLTLVVWRKDMWSLTLKWSGIWVLLIKTVIFQISHIFSHVSLFCKIILLVDL